VLGVQWALVNEYRYRWWLMIVALVFVVSIGLPHLLADSLARPLSFAGFLVNPVDGFSYLAKMRQGSEGSWTYRLAYGAEPGQGVSLFVYHLALGHLSRLAGLNSLLVYHLARLMASALLPVAIAGMLAALMADRRARLAATGLALFGSGLGWLAALAGQRASDLWIPESIPWYASLANAHFPLALGAMALFSRLLLSARPPGRLLALGAFLLGALLAVVQPFALLSLGMIAACWLVGELLISFRTKASFRQALADQRLPAMALAGFLLGALPYAAYGLAVLGSHPAFSSWNAQNLTPSPPVWEYVLGFGPALALGLAGAWRGRLHLDRSGRLLIVWAVVGFLLLYAPFSQQRRLALGLFLPMAAMAGAGLGVSPRGRRWIIAAIILTLPSNVLVVAAGLSHAGAGDSALTIQPSERAAYAWCADHCPSDALVLAGPTAGNRLPAFADVRVIYGHPFETPGAADAERIVHQAYQWSGPPDSGLDMLQDLGVEFVFYGPEEAALGSPDWLGRLDLLFQDQNWRILGVP
jgi:hypothetical protein